MSGDGGWAVSPTQAYVLRKLAEGDVLYLQEGHHLAWTLRAAGTGVSPLTYRALEDDGLLRREVVAGEDRLVLTDRGWGAYRLMEEAPCAVSA